MPLMKFDEKDSIPKELHDDVVEKDGKFEVNLSLTSKVTEFRENNTTIAKERDTLLEQNKLYLNVVGDDMDEFTESLTKMKETQQQVDDGKLTGSADIELQLKKRTEKMVSNHSDEIKQKDAKITELSDNAGVLLNEIKKNTITHAVQAVINSKDSGIQPSAASDIANRANDRFVVEKGDVIARTADGSIIYGSDGTTPESVHEWVEGLKKDSPHFFITSGGGGGGGGDEDKKYGGIPKEDFDKMTGRQKLEHANKHLPN